ncbi:SusC/RagA family TonB-linked outer membrane protein [Zobellia galactanivorans]|uniref:SusC/RagA family TonB-linked outer membrane protein n=1 Tax=Zobellia galactanivorans (strain DSM 12802 / CCUG 47099 / CIP 106680 / NCIMB 13871 / Dsij) TaxID=63186 RepID=UPI001C073134|nr:SusC/RagA family TonB-linked outer membrane protein [Zobellia galactanivorans]MBU3024046.1 SusC/RagA family TonB-linked outer membrane protein [Zobellia galactanivorans]
MKKFLDQTRRGLPLLKLNLKMKISMLFMFLVLFTMQAKTSYSQGTKITLDLSNVTVIRLIDEIESQTEFHFVYQIKDVDLNRIISVKAKQETVPQILTRIFAKTRTTHRVVDKQIFLKQRALSNNVQNSNISIIEAEIQEVVSGTVTDTNGQPLPGANIVEKGTTNGVTADFDGNFSIEVEEDSAILVVTYIGFATKEVPVDKETSLIIELQESAAGLEEVVVVGYGTVRKSDLTGAVVNADLESFKEAPNTNILQSISGSVPGLNIGQISSAGEEPSIQVRGRTSINGNLSPLIVVDGAIYRGSLNDLNPSDIEAVNVLKDASSKAIYGAQAANGVILLTTKGGKKGQRPVIRYNAYYTSQSPSNDLRTLNRNEYIEMQRDLDWRNSYLAPNYTEQNPDWKVLDALDVLPPLVQGVQDGTDSDWFGEMTGAGFINNHQLSFSGGSENTTYYISGGYTKQDNWVLNDEFERKTVRINIETKLTPWLTLGANTYGSFSDFSGVSPSIGGVISQLPFGKIRDENGKYIINPNGNAGVNGFLESEAEDSDIRNNISGVFHSIVSIPGIDGLTYRINYSHNYRWNNRFNSNIYGAGLNGSAFKDVSSTYDWSLDNIIDYKNDFGKHSIGVTLLSGRNKIEFDRTRVEGSGFDNLDLGYQSISQASVQNITSNGYRESFSYQMARLSYDYDNKYLLTATIRRDGYSGFAENKKIGYFPSLALSWVLTEDLNLGDDSILNYLKLRTSYGATGNLTNRFQSLARVDLDEDSRYVFGDGGGTLNGQSPTSLANPNLSWETTKGINLGLDFSIMNSSISGSIDYYNSKTTDLLWKQSLPSLTGFSFIQTNLGEVANSGIEVFLNSRIARQSSSSKIGWDIGVNLSANKNKINTLLGYDQDGDGKEDNLIADNLFIGESIGAIYNYDIQGIYQLTDQGNIPDGYTVGTRKIRDINEDGILNTDDRTILGRAEPAYTIGFQNTLKYNNLTLRLFIKSIQGGKDGYLGVNNPIIGELERPTTNTNVLTTVEWWSPRNPNATFKGLGTQEPLPIRNYFSRDFIRLQDISLGYDFDTSSNWMKDAGIKGLKLYLSGKNLITITDWLGWDPETGQGFTSSSPVMKSITTGLDISF